MKQLDNRHIGIILSDATMRSEDLIPSFMDFLEEIAEQCEIQEEVQAIQEDVGKLETVDESGYGTYYSDESQEEASWILNESIWDLLNDIAPDFCYFGSHPGDGACYGFWTDEESLKEAILIRLGDLTEDPDLDEIQNTMNWASDLLNSHGL
jgi:hypothetical protein